jgi:glycosyltransferase involved in cell wall biosynthesis
MRVLIYEPNQVGHRYSHVRLLIQAFADLQAEVRFFTSSAGARSTEYQMQIAPLEGRFRLETRAGLAAGAANHARAGAAEVLALARGGAADHIVLPYADGITQIAGARRLAGLYRLPENVEVESLMFRGSLAYEHAAGLGQQLRNAAWLATTAAAPWSILHHADPIIRDVLQRRGGHLFGLRHRLRLMPDPVAAPLQLSARAARQRLGLADDGRVIGSAGWLDGRKGIDRLVHAFAAAGLCATDRLLLVGHQEPEVRAAIAAYPELVRRGRIVSLDRYVSDEEFAIGVAAMDVVCTPYPRHIGSVSIVIHAAAQGRPVLAADFGWLRAVVGPFGLGKTCDVQRPNELERQIARALDDAASFRLSEAARRFVEFHSPGNFAACWTDRIRQRMGLPPAPTVRTWDWVMQARNA